MKFFRPRRRRLQPYEKDFLRSSRRQKKARSSKRWKLLNFVVILLIAALGVGIIYGISITMSVIRNADRLMRLPAGEFNHMAGNLMPQHEQVLFPSRNHDITLSGWYFKAPEGPAKGNLILVHNNRENRLQFGLETANLAQVLLNHKFNLLIFDLRHSGKSDGKLSTYGYAEYLDLLGAMDFMHQVTGDRNFVLFGVGTGCSTSLFAFERLFQDAKKEEKAEKATQDTKNPKDLNAKTDANAAPDANTKKGATENDTKATKAANVGIQVQDIKAMILDTPASSADDYIRAEIKNEGFWNRNYYYPYIPQAVKASIGDFSEGNLVPIVTSVQAPILILYPQYDNVVGTATVENLLKERNRLNHETTYIHCFEGFQGHLNAWQERREEYQEALTEFLDRYF